MNLLLDSHVLLWWLSGDSRLGTAARSAIADTPLIFVSAVTAWELTIKQRLGKLTFDFDLREELANEEFRPLRLMQKSVRGVPSGGWLVVMLSGLGVVCCNTANLSPSTVDVSSL
ncbi:MAG TPA: type II toxin-antitoxin system VapC family toxin [Mycobacteriales bacterium]|nr:type II toxin-antitoxin system VapC family toxin [Mycobacteriales bacterium]